MTTTEAYRAWRLGVISREEFLDEMIVNAQLRFRGVLDALRRYDEGGNDEPNPRV